MSVEDARSVDKRKPLCRHPDNELDTCPACVDIVPESSLVDRVKALELSVKTLEADLLNISMAKAELQEIINREFN
jgi:hypothetical protein